MVGENTTLAGGLISAATLLILDRALNTLLKRNRRLGRILEGEPILIVSGGKVLPEAMRRTRIDRDELDAAVRSHGVASVSDVSLAVVEADGRISVIPRTGAG